MMWVPEVRSQVRGGYLRRWGILPRGYTDGRHDLVWNMRDVKRSTIRSNNRLGRKGIGALNGRDANRLMWTIGEAITCRGPEEGRHGGS